MWLTIKVSLHFYFFTLSKGVDDAQSFLSYVHQTLFSHSILFSIIHYRRDYDEQKAVVV